MFHVVIHAKPDGLPCRTTTTQVGELNLSTVQPEEAIATRFQCSFEDVERRFAELERMFLEPDGSFVWVVETAVSRFQIDGNLVDDGQRLLSVELKADCDHATLDRLLEALGWPSQSLLFQLVQYGVYLDEPEFRSVCIN